MIEPVLQADCLQQAGRPGPIGSLRSKRHRHQHILQGREPWQEVERLEHQPKFVGPHPIPPRLRDPRQIDPVQEHPPGIGAHDPRDHVEQRRFSRAALPLEGTVLPCGD